MRNGDTDIIERATIQTVADRAGVSVGTVSRVINRRPGVKATTRERVLQTMEALGYRPDQAARELSFARNRTIGLHVAYGLRRLQPFFALFLSHLASHLRESGLRFEELGTRSDGMPAWLPDGLVLFGAHDDDRRIPYLRENGVPFVLLGHREDAASVAADDRDGGRQAADHLLRLGHGRIAHISGGLHTQAAYDRYLGFTTRLEEAGIAFADEGYLLEGGFTDLDSYRVFRKALESGMDVTSVFAGSDEMAMGALAAAEDCGLRVPFDLSVVGFDDIPEIAGERLTTVRQDIAELAATAVTLLQKLLKGEAAQSLLLPVHLIPRLTTGRASR